MARSQFFIKEPQNQEGSEPFAMDLSLEKATCRNYPFSGSYPTR
jgi:hypothetical protein